MHGDFFSTLNDSEGKSETDGVCMGFVFGREIVPRTFRVVIRLEKLCFIVILTPWSWQPSMELLIQ